jgi:hypothetical protein
MDEFHAVHPAGNQAVPPNIPTIQIKTMSNAAPNQPAVTKIRIEYADGSHDEMELMDASQGLYSWDRKRPTGKNARGGLYTANRIAAQLFKTALEGQLAEDQFVSKKQARILNDFIEG